MVMIAADAVLCGWQGRRGDKGVGLPGPKGEPGVSMVTTFMVMVTI